MSKNNKVLELKPPLKRKDVENLKVGDTVKVSGQIVTARDKAYSQILELENAGKKLPINLKNSIVYHCGPIAKKENNQWKIIAAGPTTSARLDKMQVEFVEKTGVRALIGKGGLGKNIVEKVSRQGCIYLAFTGGAAVLAANSIKSVEDVIWSDLGIAEAIWVLKVKDFGPLTVAIDSNGKNLYQK